jgi:hypothetical protein
MTTFLVVSSGIAAAAMKNWRIRASLVDSAEIVDIEAVAGTGSVAALVGLTEIVDIEVVAGTGSVAARVDSTEIVRVEVAADTGSAELIRCDAAACGAPCAVAVADADAVDVGVEADEVVASMVGNSARGAAREVHIEAAADADTVADTEPRQ